MRQFFIFIIIVFSILGYLLSHRPRPTETTGKTALRIYAPTSFISKWGAGPALKAEFEKSCGCSVDWLDAGDISLLMQRLKLDSADTAADLVLGLDQFNLEKANDGYEWKKIKLSDVAYAPEAVGFSEKFNFLAFDWGLLSMVVKKSQVTPLPKSMNEFLTEKFKRKVVLIDPRSSTTGFIFLMWLVQSMGEENALEYLKKMENQIIAYSPNWSGAYGLFTRGQALSTFTYTTSPLFHLLEEKNSDYVSLDLEEGSPVQIEYLGIPHSCHNCEVAEKFVQFLLSPVGQKIVMERNYMLPVIDQVRVGTSFESIRTEKAIAGALPSSADRERILQKWKEIRKRGAE